MHRILVGNKLELVGRRASEGRVAGRGGRGARWGEVQRRADGNGGRGADHAPRGRRWAAQRTPLQLQSRSIVAAPGRASRRLGFVRCKRLLCTPVRQQSESPSEALGKRLGRASWGTETSCILRFCRLPQVEARALTAHRRTDRSRRVSD